MVGRLLRLLQSESGNVATVFAIASVPLLLAAGMAIDYLSAARAQTDLQAVVDGAAMAVASSSATTNAEKIAIGKNFLKQNIDNPNLQDAVTAINISGQTVKVTASYDYPTTFMRLGGIKIMPIGSSAEVDMGNDRNAELVMVLDYSGSMKDDDKYIRMRTAATRMIDGITSSSSALKVGLVPFSAMVSAAMPKEYVSQAAANATWTGCTQDRKYPWNVSVDTPDGTADSLWGYVDNGFENAKPYDCAAYLTKTVTVLPLTSDLAAAKSQLAAMTPIGNTNIPLGVEFGWNLLDPAAPYTEGAAYDDDTTKKFMLVLTDGVQTSRQWGDKGNRSVANGNANLTSICGNVKNRGITVFTIAYDVKDPKVTTLLKGCASAGNYFEASTDGTEIDQVFKAITNRIKKSTLRLAR